MAVVFLIMSIASIAVITIFVSANASKITELKQVFTSVSMGNLGATELACNTNKFATTESSQKAKITTVYLHCPYGTLDSLNQLG